MINRKSVFASLVILASFGTGCMVASVAAAAEVSLTVAIKSSAEEQQPTEGQSTQSSSETSATATTTEAEITSDAGLDSEAIPNESASKPLSVAPINPGSLTYPPSRPSWVDQSPDMSADLHRWPVVSTPSSTAELSRQALSAQLRAAAETYVETILDETDASSIITLDDAWIESHLSADHQYEGEVFAGDEVMYESAAQLLFEPADRTWLLSRWQSHQVGERLVNLAILTFLGGTLLFVTTAGMSMVARRAERRVTQATDQ